MPHQTQDRLAGYMLPTLLRTCKVPLLWARYYYSLSASPIKSCCCSVNKPYLVLFNPINCSMPGFPVLHYFLEFAQIHIHFVNDNIQPSHPLSLPSPPALNLSQHQIPMNQLFTSDSKNIGTSALASLLPMNIQA